MSSSFSARKGVRSAARKQPAASGVRVMAICDKYPFRRCSGVQLSALQCTFL